MDDQRDVEVTLELQEGYRFLVDFNQAGVAPVIVDEPPPLGEGSGPNAVRMLAAAIGHCLSASALYCLKKARVPVPETSTRVQAGLERNQQGRLRVGKLQVALHPTIAAADRERLGRWVSCSAALPSFWSCSVRRSTCPAVSRSAVMEFLELVMGSQPLDGGSRRQRPDPGCYPPSSPTTS